MSIALSMIKYPTKIPKKVQHIFHKYKPKRRSLATHIEILRKRKLVKKARQLTKMTTPRPESLQDSSESTDRAISLTDLTYILENNDEIRPGKTVHPILLHTKLDASNALYDFAETDSDDYTINEDGSDGNSDGDSDGNTDGDIGGGGGGDSYDDSDSDSYDNSDSDSYDDSENKNDIPSSTNLLPSSREDRAQSIDSLVSEEPEIVDI